MSAPVLGTLAMLPTRCTDWGIPSCSMEASKLPYRCATRVVAVDDVVVACWLVDAVVAMLAEAWPWVALALNWPSRRSSSATDCDSVSPPWVAMNAVPPGPMCV